MKTRSPHNLSDSASLIKINLAARIWSGNADETVWAVPLPGHRAKIKNIPFYAYGLSYNDVLDVDKVVATDVNIRSGHSTYRFFMLKKNDAPLFRAYWEPLESLGCTYERASENLFAVDVPPEADIHVVYRLLEAGESDGIWEFEEGNCAHAVESD